MRPFTTRRPLDPEAERSSDLRDGRSSALQRAEWQTDGAGALSSHCTRASSHQDGEGQPLRAAPSRRPGLYGTNVPSEPAGAGRRKFPGIFFPGTPFTDCVEYEYMSTAVPIRSAFTARAWFELFANVSQAWW